MAITDGTQYDEEPVGAGLIGHSKTFFAQLVAATPYALNFGKFKLTDVENVCTHYATGDNGGSVTFLGEPNTTAEVDADGEGMTLTDSVGGAIAVTVIGVWTYK